MTPEENYLLHQLKDELQRALQDNRSLAQTNIILSREIYSLRQRELEAKLLEFSNRLHSLSPNDRHS
jgi:hypothetical protein